MQPNGIQHCLLLPALVWLVTVYAIYGMLVWKFSILRGLKSLSAISNVNDL